MSIRIAPFPLLLLGLWACGDDDDPPPVAPEPEPTVLRPSGELQPWDLSAIVPIDTVRSRPWGMPVYLRTEFANGELADLEMRFVQVVDDFLPPMPVIMVEASDPVLIQLGGIAKGMSGSPLFTEDGTWGAIAYGFGAQDSPPYYFFATPIEWVIGERSTVPLAKPAATWGGARIAPLEVPLAVTGFDPGQPLPGGGSSPWAGAVPAALTQERQQSFEAGRPLAVAVVMGEITGAALGTISYVAGDRVYGFGHPMDEAGPVELPIIEAKVLGEISNLDAPYKFATFNPTVRGTLTEDRKPAVRGVLGEKPELVTVRSVYTLGSGSVVELEHEVPPSLARDIAPVALFRPLFNRLENEPDHGLRVTAEISFVETDSTLSRTRLYAEPEGRVHSLVAIADADLSNALGELASRDDRALQVREAEVQVEVIAEPRFAKVTEVAADSVIDPGDVLAVTVSLRVGRRSEREIELALSLPETLPAGAYQLEAGSAASLGPDADDLSGFFSGLISMGGEDGEETLEDVFARVNGEDENVLLTVRLTPAEPGGDGAMGSREEEGLGDTGSGVFPSPGVPVSSQQAVDLFLVGTASQEVQVGAE